MTPGKGAVGLTEVKDIATTLDHVGGDVIFVHTFSRRVDAGKARALGATKFTEIIIERCRDRTRA